jgi:hypothetical protein
MKQLELIQKYGAPAVMFFWLLAVQLEMNDLKVRLYDCNDNRIEDYKNSPRLQSSLVGQKAILPKKIRIEKKA